MGQTAGSLNLPDPGATQPASDIPEDLMAQFTSSNETALENLESAALKLESDPSDPEPLGEAKRIIHTIKGETGMLGMSDVAAVCHDAETALEAVLADGKCPTDLLLTVKDWLQAVLAGLSSDAPPPADAVEEATSGMRILIVEDSLINQKLLDKMLSDHGERSVAGNGREGLAMFADALEQGCPFDLVCLDIMMPEMDGQEALAGMRSLESGRGILGLDGAKVIMTTALDDPANVLKAFRSGCEAYVVKPIVKESLLTEMRNLGLAV